MHLEKILKFVNLLNDFRQIKRSPLVNGEDRYENDVEHSYQLAMLAWYIVHSRKLDLNIDLVLKYSMVHDMVEIYAGDTYIYDKDKDYIESKSSREEEALERLRNEFPEFGDIFLIYEQYEKKEDKESCFVYALDKIQPVLNIYMDGGRSWKERKVTLQMLLDNKRDKVTLSPEVKEYFDELVELLKKKEGELFNTK